VTWLLCRLGRIYKLYEYDMRNTDAILASTSNRHYPLPKKKWKYFQRWHDTLFLHWEVPVYFLREHIPGEIELDTFNNMAWVSLVAFEVKNMRPRNLPSLPFISNFQEINIRTYVIKDEIPGIYMFSIETDKLIEVLLTRFLIGLPYQKSKINRTSTKLVAKNRVSNQRLDITIGKSRPLTEKTNLDFWLTERHALYDTCENEICRFDIHHKEWDLKNIKVSINDIVYEAGKFSLTILPDKIQYAEELDVLLWGKEKV
jgi:uncharacterized protein YqjF (DUF2071 family)